MRFCWLVSVALVLLGSAAVHAGKNDDDDDVGSARNRKVVLLLPAFGPADDASRRELNKRLREVLNDNGDVKLLPQDTTDSLLRDSRSMGLVCKQDDAACISKLGLLAEAQIVLVPVARGRRSLQVDLSHWDVDSGQKKFTNTMELMAGDRDMVEVLVDRAFGRGAEQKPVGTAVGSGTEQKEQKTGPCPPGAAGCISDERGVDDVDEGSASVVPWIGLGAAGVGGAVLVGSVIGASVCEVMALTADKNSDPQQRINIATAGAVLWVSAIVSGVITAGGGALWFFTKPTAPELVLAE
jgi:hypothetical protein